MRKGFAVPVLGGLVTLAAAAPVSAALAWHHAPPVTTTLHSLAHPAAAFADHTVDHSQAYASSTVKGAQGLTASTVAGALRATDETADAAGSISDGTVDQVKPAAADVVGDTGQAVDHATDHLQPVIGAAGDAAQATGDAAADTAAMAPKVVGTGLAATDAGADGVQQVGGFTASTATGALEGTSLQADACVNVGMVTPLVGATTGSCTTAGS
jgi:hypothetical protein